MAFARQRVAVQLPCGTCRHRGLCTIEEQIEADLVLNIEGVGRPVRLALSCSEYSKAGTPATLGVRRPMPSARPGAPRPRRSVSEETRARMAEGQRRRWERARGEGSPES